VIRRGALLPACGPVVLSSASSSAPPSPRLLAPPSFGSVGPFGSPPVWLSAWSWLGGCLLGPALRLAVSWGLGFVGVRLASGPGALAPAGFSGFPWLSGSPSFCSYVSYLCRTVRIFLNLRLHFSAPGRLTF